jgi:hypothetical protein
MPSTLWNENSQLRRVFGWTDILSSWDDSLNMSPYVQTVVDNLRAVSNPDSNRDLPLEHFTNFLNDEQDGLKWFLYEIISMRWMWGETRLDYIRHLVDLIDDLDSFFPHFVGSPRQTQTIREFIENNLNDEEQEFVNIMPRLVEPPLPMVAPVNRVDVTKFTPITLRFLRNGRLSSSRNDDILRIYKTTAGYNWVYNDQIDDEKTYTRDLTQLQVMQRLSNSLRLLTVDEDPFLSVQLLVPNAPSVLVSVKSLSSSTRDLFYDAVEAVLEEWPTSR